jgi:MtN3 and saliva related transmembrane protein
MKTRQPARLLVARVGRFTHHIADPSAMRLVSIDILGFVAGALSTIAFVPQVIHSWTTRDLGGISLKMYSLFTAGVALWLVYGVALGSWPIIAANAVTVLLAGSVLILKIKYM